jgi:hypothetical protein
MRLSILLGLLMLLVAGCSTIKVGSDYKTNIDFSKFKTYAWLNETDNPSDNVRMNNKMVIDSVRASVERTLNSKGYIKTDNEKADFLITWFGAIEQKMKAQNIDHFYSSYGYGTLYQDPDWNPQSQVTNIKEYEEGSLIFDFLDPESHTLLWRGIGRDKVVEGRPDDVVRQNIDKAVRQILADYPPN